MCQRFWDCLRCVSSLPQVPESASVSYYLGSLSSLACCSSSTQSPRFSVFDTQVSISHVLALLLGGTPHTVSHPVHPISPSIFFLKNVHKYQIRRYLVFCSSRAGDTFRFAVLHFHLFFVLAWRNYIGWTPILERNFTLVFPYNFNITVHKPEHFNSWA